MCDLVWELRAFNNAKVAVRAGAQCLKRLFVRLGFVGCQRDLETRHTDDARAICAKRRRVMTEYSSDLLRTLSSRGYIHQVTDAGALDALAAKQIVPVYIGFDAVSTAAEEVSRSVETVASGRSRNW